MSLKSTRPSASDPRILRAEAGLRRRVENTVASGTLVNINPIELAPPTGEAQHRFHFTGDCYNASGASQTARFRHYTYSNVTMDYSVTIPDAPNVVYHWEFLVDLRCISNQQHMMSRFLLFNSSLMGSAAGINTAESKMGRGIDSGTTRYGRFGVHVELSVASTAYSFQTNVATYERLATVADT